MTGRIERLWIKRAAGGPMDAVDRVELAAGRGIVDNADQGGWRHVTLLSAERWARVCDDLGAQIDPVLRRANMLVSGMDLVDSRGAVLTCGDVELEIRGETRPCRLMDEAWPGLQDALDADWGGGAFAYVRVGGTLHVGDELVAQAPART